MSDGWFLKVEIPNTAGLRNRKVCRLQLFNQTLLLHITLFFVVVVLPITLISTYHTRLTKPAWPSARSSWCICTYFQTVHPPQKNIKKGGFNKWVTVEAHWKTEHVLRKPRKGWKKSGNPTLWLHPISSPPVLAPDAHWSQPRANSWQLLIQSVDRPNHNQSMAIPFMLSRGQGTVMEHHKWGKRVGRDITIIILLVHSIILLY